MVTRFETYFVAYYAIFTTELENLVFVIMSTRENIHLIARTSFAGNLCKPFGPRSKVGSDLDPN